MHLRIAICFGLLLAGCHHRASAPPPLTLAEFTDEFDAAEAMLATCELGIAPQTASYLYGETESSSLALARLESDVAAGAVKFDPVKAASCIKELAAPSLCWGEAASVQGLFLNQPADCAAVLLGTIAPGGSCYDDSECLGGYCNTAACPGVCTAALAMGATCIDSEQCASGLICNVNVCEPPGALGDDCKLNNDCTSGLICLTSIAHANGTPLVPDGVCAVPLAAGASCNPIYSNSCAAGFWCLPSTDANATSPGTCTAQVGAGGACTVGHGPTGYTEPIESSQCKGHQICSELVVDSNGTVTTPGTCAAPGDVGSSCLATGVAATQGCLLGLLCDATGRCVSPPAMDAGCAAPPSDNSGLLVDYCVPGAFCTAPSSGGTCKAKLADAASGCISANNCLSGACSTSHICSAATTSGCSLPQ